MLGGKNRQLGYTIVELMIVLAISGVMFLIAASFINGRQLQVAFNSGVKTLAGQIQQVAEQVNDGQYSDEALSCTSNVAGDSVSITASGSNSSTQGLNNGCIFLGKLLYFYQMPGVSLGPRNYIVFPLAGLQTNKDTPPDLQGAGTTPIYNPGQVNLTTESETPSSLAVVKLYVNNNGAKGQTNAIGFIQNVNDQPGDQPIQMIRVNSLPLQISDPTLDYADINAASANLTNSAYLCISDGIHYAAITIGDYSNGTSTSGQTNVVINAGVNQTQCEAGTL